MELSDQTKLLILVVIFGVFVYFFTKSNNNNEPMTNDDASALPQQVNHVQNVSDSGESVIAKGSNDTTEEDSVKRYMDKFKTRNSAPEGQYAFSTFSHGRRGGASNLDKFFEGNHPLDQKNGFACDDVEETHARYVSGGQKKLRDVDKFDVDAMLPREQNKDWFDDPYQPTTIKNAHMINIYRPIGVNTIGSSMKNASRDLRGDTYKNPRLPQVSPWMNSSIQPDDNIRSERALC